MVDEAYADRTEWIKKSIQTSDKVRSLLYTFLFLLRVLIKQFNN